MNNEDQEPVNFTDEMINAVRAEFRIEGYSAEHIAALLILEAREERDVALARCRRIALTNGRLRYAATRPEAAAYEDTIAQNVAERIGFEKGIEAARVRMCCDKHKADTPRMGKLRGTLAELVERIKGRLGDADA